MKTWQPKKTIEDRYEKQTSPYYAAARMWIDAIIDPAETRAWLSMDWKWQIITQNTKFIIRVIQV